MPKPLRISISEARARLPELAQRAMAAPNGVIIIEHRYHNANLVLTTEAHYRMLEAKAHKRNKGKFKLAGSISTDLSPEELEAAIEASSAAADALSKKEIMEELYDDVR